MKHVGIFDAKTHLSSLVDEVEKGGEIIITRHGKPVAKLVARKRRIALVLKGRERRQASRNCVTWQQRDFKINSEEIKAWIEEGGIDRP